MGLRPRLEAMRVDLRDTFTQVWTKLGQNHLWQRMVKHTISVTIAFTIVIIPSVASIYGPAAFLAPMTAVFGHTGRPLGQMVESLVFILAGLIVGEAWSLLGLFLSSLIYDENLAAAYTIRAIFVLIAVVFHGYLRSHSPRLFLFVLLVLITSFTTLMGTQTHVSLATATNIIYPILTTLAILLLVNIIVFPEFSSDYLGTVTIDTLGQTEAALKLATEWFVEPAAEQGASRRGSSGSKAEDEKSESSSEPGPQQTRLSRLTDLTKAKGKLRSRLSVCKATYEECTYEITYSLLPPRSMKSISNTHLSELVRNVIMLISACESRYALIGHGDEEDEASKSSETERPHSSHSLESVEGLQSPMDSSSEDDTSSDDGVEIKVKGSGKQKDKQKRPPRSKADPLAAIKLLKATPEIASGDLELLESLLLRVREPVSNMLDQTKNAIDLVMVCLAYCFEVKRLPDGTPTPKGIMLEEIDIRVDLFDNAITDFDKSYTGALMKAASLEKKEMQLDIMPRQETFLVSSALLSFRQAASQALQMLKEARKLVERREARGGWKRVYWPRKMNWKKWLALAGEADIHSLPQNARKQVRTGKSSESDDKDNEDEDDDNNDVGGLLAKKPRRPAGVDEEASEKPRVAVSSPPPSAQPRGKPASEKKTAKGGILGSDVHAAPRSRQLVADFFESVQHSEHLSFALKLAIAVFLSSFPAFYAPWNSWYNTSRASWASLQLVLVFEVAIGPSFSTFLVRAFGVVLGCFWGYVAYELGRGQLPAIVVILVVGIIPSTYVQLATPYVKAGMIAIVSMCVVALATVQNTSTPAWENFLKRMAAFVAGGAIALLVEMVLYPVRARHRLVESLSACIGQVAHMEAVIAAGVEHPENLGNIKSARQYKRFSRAKSKAQSALSAAETFLPFCLAEPRLKGSFTVLYPIYQDIIYVLHQIIDRMDNMMALRKAYGSSALEDMNAHIHAYRRNVAASVTLTLFAVNEALITKQPMPQYLPSCRVAQKRLVYRVREVLRSRSGSVGTPSHSYGFSRPSTRPSTPRHSAVNLAQLGHTSMQRNISAMSVPQLDEDTIRLAIQPKLLSWNAASAGRMDIIEFLEELVNCTKRLVGENAFRGGMLERPSYRNYMKKMKLREQSVFMEGQAPPLSGEVGYDLEVAVTEGSRASEGPVTFRRRRRTTVGSRGQVPIGVSGRRPSAPVAGDHRPSFKRSDDDLPASLQRVGTRIREERTIARRMTMSENARKGKAVDMGVSTGRS
ncbi:hypothetical protein GQ53DRAFT_839737 [Thozetella sp. PMI_491]|nr:hypothetical protein GQ53DRAFT_839737 [Thozetella sp. PMI_491]